MLALVTGFCNFGLCVHAVLSANLDSDVIIWRLYSQGMLPFVLLDENKRLFSRRCVPSVVQLVGRG